MHIRFDKVDEFIILHYGTRYLVLFGNERYDFSCNKIRYITGVKSNVTYVISHNYAKIKVDSYNSLLFAKTLTFHNVILLIKSVFNKDRNNYCCNMFLEKGSYELPKNNDNK